MKLNQNSKHFLLGLSLSVIVIISFFIGAISDRVFGVKPLDYFLKRKSGTVSIGNTNSSSPLSDFLNNTSSASVADVAEVASKSVVTVSIKKQQRVIDPSASGIFGFYFGMPTGETKEVQQDIGSGFVVDGSSGLIVTNKHVVSDTTAQYSVVDSDDKEYAVTRIYRDPVNDLAIVKIDDTNLPSLPLGDSDNIRVGESVIAIGTALGEFRHTVTTGVVSGLGRGIQAIAGTGQAESLDNVIQTDAAINPGNSGGPLLNDHGQVIGVNVAVSVSGENIGFALPINVIKASIDNFNQTGQFDRAFFGVQYTLISQEAALVNEVPQGAYISAVTPNSAAAEAGLQPGDILTEFDGHKITEDANLARLVNDKKVGDKVKVKYWRDQQTIEKEVTLKASEE